MKSYPDIYILGRMVDGVYVEHGTTLYLSFEIADMNRKELQRNNMLSGTWQVLKFGRPRTVRNN